MRSREDILKMLSLTEPPQPEPPSSLTLQIKGGWAVQVQRIGVLVHMEMTDGRYHTTIHSALARQEALELAATLAYFAQEA